MSSIRQQIVDAIATRLRLIHSGHVFTLSDGDYTCASTPLSVTEWKRVPYGLAQVPAIAFWDTESDLADGGPIGQFEHRLMLSVVCFTAGATAIDDARAMLADIVAAVGSDPRWGGLATWTEIGNHQLTVDQAADQVSATELKLVVIYRTSLWRM
jgi:hypothetical protein